MQVNSERFVHEFTVADRSPMDVLDNWQVKDALVSKVSVDARGHNQFTVGGERRRPPTLGKDGDTTFYPGDTHSPVAPVKYADSTRKPCRSSIRGAGGTSVSMTATYNTKLTAAALDAGKGSSTRARPSRATKLRVSFAIQSDAVALSVPCRSPRASHSPDQPTFFITAVTFTATYSEPNLLHGGTRDVEAR